jgi:SAM-dependent methyltransferase
MVLSLLSESIDHGGRVLDAGCGLGYLANSIASAGYQVEAVDPSSQSIEYARKNFPRIKFQSQTAETHAADWRNIAQYDAVVANMVMHATPQITTFITSVSELLKPGGSFIATIPHPCFFLPARNFVPMPFNYSNRRGLLIPFKIHGGRTHPEPVPYFQRTLQDYSDALRSSGLDSLWIREPQRVGDEHNNTLALLASRKFDRRS